MTPPRISESSVAEWFSALSVINEQIGQKNGLLILIIQCNTMVLHALHHFMWTLINSSLCLISLDSIHVATMEKLHKNYENNWQVCLAEVDLFKVRNKLSFLICFDCQNTTPTQQFSQLFTHRQRHLHSDSPQTRYRILLMWRYYLSLASARDKWTSIWKNWM